jgi:uncharacterized protein (TIGR00369 family)
MSTDGNSEGQRRVLTVTWDDPMPYLQEAMASAPLGYLRKMINGEIPRAPIGALMGLGGVEIEEGRAVLYADPGEHHYNSLGMVHGGLAATLLDTAMGFAVHSTLPQGGYFSTLEMSIGFVRPITEATGRVTCTGSTIHVGKTVGRAEGNLTDANGKLLAHATCTCLVFRP